MLGKLLKSEFQQTYKPIVLMYFITAGITLLTCITDSFSFEMQMNAFGRVLTNLLGISFILSLIGVVFVCFIISCYNFYKSMYSERGYLTHTMPVKTTTTFTVKYIVAIIWIALAAILMFACITASMCTELHASPLEVWSKLADSWKLMDLQVGISRIIFFQDTLGASVAIFALLILFGIAHSLLFIFTSLTIGQLSNNHKIGCSVGAGVGLYFVGQIFGSILLVSKILPMVATSFDESETIQNANYIFTIILVFLAVFMVMEYVLNMFIVKKHINLQ